jgi:hypothetical protein
MKTLLSWCKINLRILAKIKPSGRIGTKGKTVVIEKESAWQCLWRLWNHDSRTEAVETIKSIVQVAIELSECIVQSRQFSDFVEDRDVSEYNTLNFKTKCRQLHDIADDLKSSVEGVKNLMTAYEGDEKIISEFEVVIGTIQDQSANIYQTIEQAVSRYNRTHEETALAMKDLHFPQEPTS